MGSIETMTVRFAFLREDSWEPKPRAINGIAIQNRENGPILIESVAQLNKEG